MIKAKDVDNGRLFTYLNMATGDWNTCCRVVVEEHKGTEIPTINLSHPEAIWWLLPNQDVAV